MPDFNLPNNWEPRRHQYKLWNYLITGGLRAVEIAHRRWGKDDVALHFTAVAVHERVGNYAHCLPEYSQARKAIWNSVNPHTGKRRIDEAFPPAIRANTNDQEMMIRFLNGSTWQVLGSDQYDRLVGTAYAGIVFSEWALANPTAWGYVSPILKENKGWAIFITTPRGRNHAYKMHAMAAALPDWFSEISSIEKTNIFSQANLADTRAEYHALYGEDAGDAMFEQEYNCNFNAPILGAYYGRELDKAERDGRICKAPYDPAVPAQTIWDVGYSDDTAIWFMQVVRNEIHFIDHYASSGRDIEHYAKTITDKPYKCSTHWLPHDAKAKTLASGGKSIQEQLQATLGYGTVRITPSLSIEDGIQAARAMFGRVWFDAEKCKSGIECLRNYHREWDDSRKCFKDLPAHDWSSHTADAFRYAAVVWREEYVATKQPDDYDELDGYGNPIINTNSWKVN